MDVFTCSVDEVIKWEGPDCIIQKEYTILLPNMATIVVAHGRFWGLGKQLWEKELNRLYAQWYENIKKSSSS